MKSLENTLAQMAALHIHNKEMLLPYRALHEELFLSLDTFIVETVFCSKKNMNQLYKLTHEYGIETDDIRFDCLERCILKLELILTNKLENQIPYIHTICNNIIVDCFRKAAKHALTTVSLNKELNIHDNKDDSKKSKSIEDYIMDLRACTESNYIAKTQILEILDKYSSNADSLLCAIATKIAGDKPAELAQVIIAAGSVEKALIFYLENIHKEFGIGYNEFPKLPRVKNTGLNKLISKDNASSQTVSAKISNILNRTK